MTRGRGRGSSSGGKGRMGGNKAGAGPGGKCVCPSCGKEITHKPGVPCYKEECPECGTRMVRK